MFTDTAYPEDPWDLVQQADLDNLFDMDFEPIKDNVEIMKHLSDFDYSLNSPLVLDELEGLYNWLKTGNSERRWDTGRWIKLKKDLPKKIELEHPSSFSRWFGNFNQNEKYTQVPLMNSILEKTLTSSRRTEPVLKAFLKGWLNLDISFTQVNKLNLRCEELRWAHYFWELHACTLMLNCATKKECAHLSRTFDCKISSKKDSHYSFIYPTKNFGTCYISQGFVYSDKFRRIFDRNTVLMMKDTYIGRFNTFLSIKNRLDQLFDKNLSSTLSQVYKLGDAMLEEAGQLAYDNIKLIEPMCNDRISIISQHYRPLIPLFPDFSQHVNDSVKKGSLINPSLRRLYNLISSIGDIESLLTIYGSFRHWGHPYINYLEGLEKLHFQTTMTKVIDTQYADKLASDLAFTVIKDQFRVKRSWPVDIENVEITNLLYPNITKNTWPNNGVIADFGDNWHKLPLKKCFEIPDVVDPSIIYADKSHSMTRSELIAHLRKGDTKVIPSIKVLSSLLQNPATDWPQFLQKVNDSGISEDHLIIGLKLKERELKTIGRFFALMSWEIRDYFVMTEYLIKTHFVPLFRGLTMADDLTTVVGKMLENTKGQGEPNYETITIANHIDYEKWNNHQRGEANNPVFHVMGQFLGYPKLIERTHEIFKKSWIYYNHRGDLLSVDGNGKLCSKSKSKIFWEGQEGGLEGLRQKGWSICNLLVIKRESYSVNTRVKVLAQGDNQVICSQYKLRPFRNREQLIYNIDRICRNNQLLFDRISDGTKKLGLLINHDETMRSAEFLNYGKTCVVRGNIRNLETKRWSRVTCVTNDQLPTMANILSTTSSNALTVSHFSDSPINSMHHYNFVGHLVRLICETHNPAIRGPIKEIMNLEDNDLTSLNYLFKVLYLDPSIGGVCGMSLTRFIVRMFPDPITESLSFLKLIAENTEDIELKTIVINCGHPKIKQESRPDLSKLIEDPLSLNIPRGIDAVTLIKDQIKKSLLNENHHIKNHVIRTAVKHQKAHEGGFIAHLRLIDPLFPRFLSEYRSATYFGITDSMIGLFQNSKTIRKNFKKDLSRKYDQIIIKSELMSMNSLIKRSKTPRNTLWKCSSHHADLLRKMSWGKIVYGATVPHPVELFKNPELSSAHCKDCFTPFPQSLYISILVPGGFLNLKEERGRYAAYLGSSTLESTSILQSWERETKIPLIRRAASLRSSIGWFIEPRSNLAKSILDNLHALTGEDWSKSLEGFKRTGSALHRFNCSRQSNGGYAAQNPSKLTRMIATTNSLADLGDTNYDFMYQNCLLNSLMSVGEVHYLASHQGYYHHHIKCISCLREISEIKLDCPTFYSHVPVFEVLNAWKPSDSHWSVRSPSVGLQLGNWEVLSTEEKSFHIGLAQGFIYGDSTWGLQKAAEDPALFPLTIRKKVDPNMYLEGLIRGIIRSSIVSIIHQRRLKTTGSYYQHILGQSSLTVDRISRNLNLLNIWRETSFIKLFSSIPHQIPPSYPMIMGDIGSLGMNYLRHLLVKRGKEFLTQPHRSWENKIWIFSDIYQFQIIVLLAVSERCWSLLRSSPRLTKDHRFKIDELRKLSAQVRDKETYYDDFSFLGNLLKPLIYTDSEVRHAAKSCPSQDEKEKREDHIIEWGEEFYGQCTAIEVEFLPQKPSVLPCPELPRFQNPLISGLRLAQIATGAHYKMREILNYLKLTVRGAISAGDGSGGIGALILRMYKNSKIIFNSLCDYDNVQLKGNNPSPPSAIAHSISDTSRCLNFNDAWANPNDLSRSSTWRYFSDLAHQRCLVIDLITMDMEVQNEEMMDKIENKVMIWGPKLLDRSGVIIFKTYLTRIFGRGRHILENAGVHFSRVEVVTTSVTSSQSSEVYVILTGLKNFKTYDVAFPNLFQLRKDLTKFPIFSTEADEFRRALKLRNKDLLKGVPRSLITNPRVELLKLLNRLGVRSDLSYRYSESLISNKLSSDEPIALFVLVIHAIIPFTMGSVHPPPPPSDGTIIQLASWITGFLIWYGYSTTCFQITQLAQSFINNYFPFYYQHRRFRKLFLPCFKITEKEGLFKPIQLDPNMALIGSIIRVLVRNYGKIIYPPHYSRSDHYCTLFYSKLTIQEFNQATKIIDLIRDPSILPPFGKVFFCEPIVDENIDRPDYYHQRD